MSRRERKLIILKVNAIYFRSVFIIIITSCVRMPVMHSKKSLKSSSFSYFLSLAVIPSSYSYMSVAFYLLALITY